MEEASASLPDRLNMTQLALDRWADREDGNDTPAIYHEDKVTSYRELQKLVNRLGNCLRNNDVRPGDKVLLRMRNHPLYIALSMAIIKIGAIVVPTSTLFRMREIEYILTNSEAKIAISLPELLPALEDAALKVETLKKIFTVLGDHPQYESIEKMTADEADELGVYDSMKDDIAFILYTSGTTAFPKGIPHSHGWLLAVGEPNSHFVMGLQRGDRILTPIEMTWMWSWSYCIWFTMYKGASTCVYSGEFDSEKTFQRVQKYKATHLLGNPTIYRRLLRVEDAEKKYELTFLKAAFSSGETLAPEIFREWKRRFNTEIFDCMGQTESNVFCATRPGVIKLGSMGKPLPGIPVAVIKEDGSLCAEREIGLLAIERRFAGLTPGYLGLEDEWRAKIKGDWYLTGDYAYVDEDGFYWYVSRTDDLIKSRGYLIAPKEIEDVLHEHHAVLESAVVGARDTELREKVVAFIVLRDGQIPSRDMAVNIRQFLVERIAPFKAPKEIVFTKSLPKTVTGKIMRKVLKQNEEKGSARMQNLQTYAYVF